jgi:hypothetical protein
VGQVLQPAQFAPAPAHPPRQGGSVDGAAIVHHLRPEVLSDLRHDPCLGVEVVHHLVGRQGDRLASVKRPRAVVLAGAYAPSQAHRDDAAHFLAMMPPKTRAALSGAPITTSIVSQKALGVGLSLQQACHRR